MASVDYSSLGGSAHPYLHEPRIYITGLPAFVSDIAAGLAIAGAVMASVGQAAVKNE